MFSNGKEKSFVAICLWLLFPLVAFCHNPSKSSTMLVEGKNGHWTLQIRASLTAFEQVVHSAYTKKGYKTPEEFQDLMATLLSKSLHLKIDHTNITLKEPIIKLGHETVVVYQFVPPTDFKDVSLQNLMFQDINGSSMGFMVLKNGLKRNLFTLNKDNAFSSAVTLKDDAFVLDEPSNGLAGIGISWYIFAFAIIGGATFGLVKRYKKPSVSA